MNHEVEQRIRAMVTAHPDWDVRRICHALWRYRVPAAEVRAVLGRCNGKSEGPRPGAPPAGAATYSVRSLLEQFDDVGRLRRYLDGMPKDEYRPDEELRRELRITPERWRVVIQHPKVANWRYRLPNQRWVWMHPMQQRVLDDLIRLTAARET